MMILLSFLNKYNIDPNAKLSKEKEYSLKLLITPYSTDIPNFMIKMQEYKFDQLRKLAIDNIEELNGTHVKELNRFLKY